MVAKTGLNIFIFHRDLRIVDNTALLTAPKPITPVFMFIDEQIDPAKNAYYSNNSVQFMCESLVDLDKSLRKVSSHLNLFRTSSIVSQLETIHKNTPITSLTQNADFSLYAKKRDAEIQKWCDSQEPKIQFNNVPNDYDIVAENEGLLPNNKPYYVLAAYYRRIIKDIREKRIAINVSNHKFTKRDFKTQFLPNQISFETIKSYYTHNANLITQGGRSFALKRLDILSKLHDYDNDRNYPSRELTTQLSAHLKFGTLSVRELVHAVCNAFKLSETNPDHPLVRELVFRSFYIKMAIEKPGLQRDKSFRQDIDTHIPWLTKSSPQYAKLWKAWTTGNTGFPLADAGMRQLNATGFMHGRVRMVTATVLTRYFMIDWRDGAKYFAQNLTDYDPISNNMGWQFSASLGENSQNVYRAPMNPFLQSDKYDPDATYIKKWIPELKDIQSKDIHKGIWDPETTKYTKPIIDQKAASAKTVETWRKIASNLKK